MNKIVLLRGNCASGKSTTGIALQRKLGRGTFLIPQDIVRREMLWEKDAPNIQTIDLLIQMVSFGNKNCGCTILEGILYSDIYEKLFDHIAKIYKNQVFAYYLEAPFNLTVQRQKQRPTHNEFGETEMKRWWREKDYLKIIKEKIIDTEKTKTDEIVESILKDLSTDN